VAKLSLLVLENPWNDSVADAISVGPFVEGFSRWARDVRTYSRPFFRGDELQIWLDDFARPRHGIGRRLIYVAAHGSPGRLGGLPDGSGAMNFASLVTVLRRVGGIEGIHLGCCEVGNPRNMARLLKRDRRRRTKPFRWVAGYREYIDWLDSMIVDMLFWRALLVDPKHDAWAAVRKTYREFPKARKLGFGVVMNGRGGRLHDSLEEIEVPG